MSRIPNRTAALVGVLALAAAATAASFADPDRAQEMEPEVTVELSEKNGSGVTGTARIYEKGEMGEHREMEEDEAHEREKGERGKMHAHRVVVELRGLEAGATYPVHVHQGTCAEGGGVVLPLESVTGGEDGTGSSTTEVSPEQMHEMMKKLMEARGGMEGMEHGAMEDTARGGMHDEDMGRHEEMMEDHGEMEHPPVYVQAHLPDGTPAACGDVPTEDDDEDEG